MNTTAESAQKHSTSRIIDLVFGLMLGAVTAYGILVTIQLNAATELMTTCPSEVLSDPDQEIRNSRLFAKVS